MKNTGMPTHRRYEEERRGDARFDVRLPARLVHDHGTIDGEIDNLSTGGAGFSTRQVEPELSEGDRIVLRSVVSTPAGERRIERRGTILRCEDFIDDGVDVLTYAISFDERIGRDFIDDVR